MTATTAKLLEALKADLGFIGREIQRIPVADSDGFDSVDAIGQTVEIALTRIFEIELDAQPDTSDQLIAA